MPRESTLPRIYEITSKYYTVIGNKKESMMYMDSLRAVKKQYDEQYSAILLLRMEQKESAQQQLELAREKDSRRQIQIRLLIISTGFIIVSVSLALLFVFYRRNRAAYRVLVRKSQEWAQEIADNNAESEHSIEETDKKLFDQFQQLLQREHLYRENDISIEKIALIINTNRTYLSRAINKCTRKNFSSCINEYRIKEAVLMMTKVSEKFSFEGIAFEVGFNDRKTFYTAFKKITGLSPSAFRGNLRIG
jgi:AraC-like DNA-binding protein